MGDCFTFLILYIMYSVCTIITLCKLIALCAHATAYVYTNNYRCICTVHSKRAHDIG